MSASIKSSNLMMNSLNLSTEMLKQKDESGRHEVYARDTLAKANRFIAQVDAAIGGRMNFNLNDRKIEQRNRKIADFPFVVYWRHYG